MMYRPWSVTKRSTHMSDATAMQKSALPMLFRRRFALRRYYLAKSYIDIFHT